MMIVKKDNKKRVAKQNAFDKLKEQQADSEEYDFSLPSSIKGVSASISGSSKRSSILNSAGQTIIRKVLPFSSGTQTFITAIM